MQREKIANYKCIIITFKLYANTGKVKNYQVGEHIKRKRRVVLSEKYHWKCSKEVANLPTKRMGKIFNYGNFDRYMKEKR